MAKGTIYLHFSDKEALLEGIVLQEIRPKLDTAAAAASANATLHDFLQFVLLPLLNDFVQSRRGEVLRMLIGEAGRFPKLAEIYYRTVVEPGLHVMLRLLKRARNAGELGDDLLVQFPQ